MAVLNFGGAEFIGEPGVLSLEADWNAGSVTNPYTFVYEINRVRAYLQNLQANGDVFEPVEILQNPVTTTPPLAITVTPPPNNNGTVGTNVTAGPAGEAFPSAVGPATSSSVGSAQPSNIGTAQPSAVNTAHVTSIEPGPSPSSGTGTGIPTTAAGSDAGTNSDIGTGEFPQVASETAAPNTMAAQGQATTVNGGQSSDQLTADISNIEINPQPNQLSDFASYTYNLELYMLSPKNYVQMLKNPNDFSNLLQQHAVPIIRSGGIGNDGPEQFNIDFFIDNLKLVNLATAPSTRSSNTNAVSLSFEITEPNGVTLLERLKDAATTMLEESQNYVQTPYLMKIKFKGYDDTGAEIIGSIKPKHIPIRITDIKFSVSESGSVYKVEAIPYSHSVLSSIMSTIPINIQVSASTVQDIFQGAASLEEQKFVKGKVVDDFGGGEGEGLILKNGFGEPNTTLQEAMNNFYKEKTKSTTDKKTNKTVPSAAKLADKISFKFAKEIGGAKVQAEKFDALNTPQPNDKAYKTIAGAVKGKVSVDKANNLFKINAGTNINALLNYVIVASNYLDQNLNEEAQGSEKDTIKWFKVTPEIQEFLGWDDKEGRYKFHIQYTVSVNTVFYQDFPWAAKSKPKGKGVHKIYDYIFTGNNTEVQSFKLNLDVAYYQARTLGTGTPDRDPKNPEDVHAPMKDVPAQNQNIINDETITAKRKKDFFETVMHDGADLVQVDMDILGDPAFFPTGDAMYQPQGNGNKPYGPFLPDGTINYDLTPPYVQVNLVTPTDYDPVTGLMDVTKESKYGSSQFNGVYRVTQTQSNFTGGVFTQTLFMLREKMQPVDGKVGRNANSIASMERKFQIDTFSNLAFQQLSSGKNPLASLAKQSVTTITTTNASAVDTFGELNTPAVDTFGELNTQAPAVDTFEEIPTSNVNDLFT